jgi:hypothetical protein
MSLQPALTSYCDLTPQTHARCCLRPPRASRSRCPPARSTALRALAALSAGLAAPAASPVQLTVPAALATSPALPACPPRLARLVCSSTPPLSPFSSALPASSASAHMQAIFNSGRGRPQPVEPATVRARCASPPRQFTAPAHCARLRRASAAPGSTHAGSAPRLSARHACPPVLRALAPARRRIAYARNRHP